MKAAIIILHYGDIRTTRQCIQGLLTYEVSPFSLIIVNNTKELYSPKDFSYNRCFVVNNKKNLGFSGGVNKGIRKALQMKADYVCLLNNDTIIHQPILKKLLPVFADKNVGIVSPAIRFKRNNEELYDLGGKLNTFFLRTSHTEVKKIINKSMRSVTYVSGCCMVIRKEVVQKIGLFDDAFFLYYEDVDYCLRAKKYGFGIRVVPQLVIDHELSKSVGKMSPLAIYHLLKSGIVFGRKYARNPIQVMLHRLFILFQAGLFFKANPRAAKAIATALLSS